MLIHMSGGSTGSSWIPSRRKKNLEEDGGGLSEKGGGGVLTQNGGAMCGKIKSMMKYTQNIIKTDAEGT
jgi:hypothetical protein